jgi:hypothetical protein
MARTTKQLSGGGKDKFLRALIAEARLPSAKSTALGDAMCDAISDVRVRRDAWEPRRQGANDAAEAPSSAAPEVKPASAPAFDPFVFSALAVLTKQGRPALVERLASITAATDLQALAKAQHLGVDHTLTDAGALRAAIAAATEARLAERRAAAS